MEINTPSIDPVAQDQSQFQLELEKTTQEKKISENILKQKSVFEGATQTKRLEIQEIWKALNGELSANVYPWENPQFIPKMRTEVAFVTPFIFSGELEMEVDMIGDEDKETSFLLDKILSYRIEKNPDLYEKALAWVTQGVALGTSCFKIGWSIEQGPDGIPIEKPVFSVPHILDIYTNPMIPDIDGQAAVIERIPMMIGDIKKSASFNENKLKVKAKQKSTDINYGAEAMDKVDLDDSDSVNTEFEIIDVYERWSKESVQTIADCDTGPILLRDEPNPYGFIPYVKFGFEQEIIPNRFYCKGIGQNTIGLQEMHYDLFNLVMLNLKIIVNKMFRVNPGSRVNPEDLIARPGGTIRAQKDEIEVIEPGDLKGSSFQMLNLISDEHKRASGATDLIQGSPGSRTLGQDQLAQSNVSNRFELVKKKLKASLSKAGWMVLRMELISLQSPDATIMKIFPETERLTVFQFLMTVVKNLQFDCLVRGDTGTVGNKDILAKQLMDLLNISAQDLMPQERRKFAQEIARLRGVPNVKELIPDMPGIVPGMQPGMQPMQPGMPGAPAGPVDGNALPEQRAMATPEGINESVYGFEKPYSR